MFYQVKKVGWNRVYRIPLLEFIIKFSRWKKFKIWQINNSRKLKSFKGDFKKFRMTQDTLCNSNEGIFKVLRFPDLYLLLDHLVSEIITIFHPFKINKGFLSWETQNICHLEQNSILILAAVSAVNTLSLRKVN